LSRPVLGFAQVRELKLQSEQEATPVLSQMALAR